MRTWLGIPSHFQKLGQPKKQRSRQSRHLPRPVKTGVRFLTHLTKFYNSDTLEKMASLIERASNNKTIERETLVIELVDLFEAIVGLPESEESLVRAMAEEEEPNDAQLAAVFRDARLADDPIAVVSSEYIAFTRLKLHLRSREHSRQYRKDGCRPSLIYELWSSMSEAERATVLNSIRHLAQFFDSQVPRARPKNNRLDTALFELAGVFVDFAGLKHHQYELPHSVESQFIQFCTLATGPFFHPNLTSQTALARRWYRLKESQEVVPIS